MKLGDEQSKQGGARVRIPPPLVFLAAIAAGWFAPGLRVSNSRMTPVFRSTTGAGLPMVSSPASAIFCSGDHVFPRSKLRRNFWRACDRAHPERRS